MSESPLDVDLAPTHATRESGNLESNATIDYKSEIIRKSIHLCSFSIPVIYFFISKSFALALLVPTFLGFFLVDLARFYHKPTRQWFIRWFGWLLRKHETDQAVKRFTGATNILFSAIVCVLLFPKIITVSAFAILIVSDITSALVGRRYGRRRFLQKSLVGATAFFVSAVIVVLLAPKVEGLALEYGIGIIAAAAGAVIESMSTKLDDNITVPLGIGVVMWALYALLLPAVDLYRII
jgi:dolichol kinase